MIYNTEACFAGNSPIYFLVHRLVDIEHLAALFTPEMVMIIHSGIKPARSTAKVEL
jgi:hypothetical protein